MTEWTEEDTFKRLKGITKDQIEEIIDKAFIVDNFRHRSYSERIYIIDKELAPYGWTYERYVEYYY